MKLIINNINKIENAEIKLAGLTVIAGENSTGKSTIGKLLFSIVKSVTNASSVQETDRENRLQENVNLLYQRLEGVFVREQNATLDALFPLPASKFVDNLLTLSNAAQIDAAIHTRWEILQALDIAPSIKSLIANDLENIEINLKRQGIAADIASEISYFIESEFMNNICSYGSKVSSFNLDAEDGNDSHISARIISNRVEHVQTNAQVAMLKEATYVESPLYIHLLDSLLSSATFRDIGTSKDRKPMIPIHIKDLAEKIDSLRIYQVKKSIQESLKIDEIVDGHFMFDPTSRRLLFKQKGEFLSPINVASGVKSFGIVEMLLETNMLSGDKMLIWDEPENHLNPKWQIEFASVFVQLAKAGVPILVSTHSPYFVQAIRYFSEKYELTKFVNYYLAEIGTNGLSKVDDVSTDLNRIFLKLALPLQEIMNLPFGGAKRIN